MYELAAAETEKENRVWGGGLKADPRLKFWYGFGFSVNNNSSDCCIRRNGRAYFSCAGWQHPQGTDGQRVITSSPGTACFCEQKNTAVPPFMAYLLAAGLSPGSQPPQKWHRMLHGGRGSQLCIAWQAEQSWRHGAITRVASALLKFTVSHGYRTHSFPQQALNPPTVDG